MAIEMRKKKDEEREAWLKSDMAENLLFKPSGIKYKSNPEPENRPAAVEPVIKGAPLQGESPYKTPPSNYDIFPNTNYMADGLNAEREGRFNDAAYFFGMHDAKIDAGLGGGYAKFNPYRYNSKNADKIADLRDRWENYDDFSYDPTEDEAYKALAGVYSKNAKDASANALGLAAAANGGQMSSNAVIASNLAYQNKMAGLEAEIPQLRELAYRMYLGDKEDLRTTLNDYMYQEEQDYNRWENDLNRRIENQKYANDMRKAEEQTTYNRNKAEEQEAYNRAFERWMSLGAIGNEADAITLGMPVGTPIKDSYIWSHEFNYEKERDKEEQNARREDTNYQRGLDLIEMEIYLREQVKKGLISQDVMNTLLKSVYPDYRAPGVTYNSQGTASGGSSGGGGVNYNLPANGAAPSSGNAQSVYDAAIQNGGNITDMANYISNAVHNGEISDEEGEKLVKKLLG